MLQKLKEMLKNQLTMERAIVLIQSFVAVAAILLAIKQESAKQIKHREKQMKTETKFREKMQKLQYKAEYKQAKLKASNEYRQEKLKLSKAGKQQGKA